MKPLIVHSSEPVTLLGGGAALTTDVHEALSIAPRCVAADGGAELARRSGVTPEAVIGDFDSVSPETLDLTPVARQIRIAEQDSTDFDKALRHIAAPVVVGVGFTGVRMDHQLAALHVLAAYAHRPCVLLGAIEVLFLCPPRIRLDTRAGDVVSLFPMAPVAGTSEGLRWPIAGLAFDPMSRVGTSNMATGPLTLTMDGPAMLVLLPRAHLAGVTRALGSAPQDARWTARAG